MYIAGCHAPAIYMYMYVCMLPHDIHVLEVTHIYIRGIQMFAFNLIIYIQYGAIKSTCLWEDRLSSPPYIDPLMLNIFIHTTYILIGKKIANVFRPRFWRYTITSIVWYCGTVGCKNEQGKSGKFFYHFPTEEKKKEAFIAATKREKIGTQHGVSMYEVHTFLLLVAILACIYEVSMIWTYVFMFMIVVSFCVEWGPWPLPGIHCNDPQNSMKQPLFAPSVFAFMIESGKKQEEC